MPEAQFLANPTKRFAPLPTAIAFLAASKKDVARFVVTPSLARQLLKNVDPDQQRSVQQYYVEKLARDMESGNWAGMNGNTITISKTNRLINGQHRLLACILADTPFQTILSLNAEDKDFHTIDTHGQRSAAVAFKGQGFSNPKVMAPATQLVYQYEQGVPMGKTGNRVASTNSERVEVSQRHPELESRTEEVVQMLKGNQLLRNRRAVLAALYYFGCQVNEEKAQVFINRLINGLNLTPGSPITLLRNRMLKSARKQNINAQDINHLAVKAFNMFLRGDKAERLMLSEKFPSVDGYKEFGYLAAEQEPLPA